MARPFQYRDTILALLKENPIHPTVDWIHVELRRGHPRVSLATVYRTLKTLVSEGILCELPFGTSEARFGLVMTEQHYHFICDVCRRIYDLPLTPRIPIENAIQKGTGHEVKRHTMEFYGRCRECAEKAEAEARRTRPQRRKGNASKGDTRGSS